MTSHEIAASTAQLVAASRVKADKDSPHFGKVWSALNLSSDQSAYNFARFKPRMTPKHVSTPSLSIIQFHTQQVIGASKSVATATATVVAASKQCMKMTEESKIVGVDYSQLSAVQVQLKITIQIWRLCCVT